MLFSYSTNPNPTQINMNGTSFRMQNAPEPKKAPKVPEMYHHIINIGKLLVISAHSNKMCQVIHRFMCAVAAIIWINVSLYMVYLFVDIVKEKYVILMVQAIWFDAQDVVQ